MQRFRIVSGACVALLGVLSLRTLAAEDPAPDAKRKDSKRNAEEKYKDDPVAQAHKEFQKELDATPTAELKERAASERVAYDRWRQQNHLDGGCAIKPRFASSAQREAKLVAQCKEWKEKIAMIERTIDSRLRAAGQAKEDAADREQQEFQKKLDNMSTAALKELAADELVAYTRWRRQNHLGSDCVIAKEGSAKLATSAEREAMLIAQCKDWQRKIALIQKTMQGRLKAAK